MGPDRTPDRPDVGAPKRERGWFAAAMRSPRKLLAGYLVLLVLVAFWPVPVDSAAHGLLEAITNALPWLTYSRIEFAANIILFVPLGWLLALILPRSRYLVLPIAIVATVVIESVQALILARRTPSVFDIIANTAGACIGLLIAAVIESRRRRRT